MMNDKAMHIYSLADQENQAHGFWQENYYVIIFPTIIAYPRSYLCIIQMH